MDKTALSELNTKLNITDICEYIRSKSRGSYIILKTICFYKRLEDKVKNNSDFKYLLNVAIQSEGPSEGPSEGGRRLRNPHRRKKTHRRRKTYRRNYRRQTKRRA